LVKSGWGRVKGWIKTGEEGVSLKLNTIDCIDAVMDKWTWHAFMAEMRKPEYLWGLVHGDFHPGQIMYGNADAELVLLDWEWSGFMASPAIDIATFTISEIDKKDRRSHEASGIPAYYSALIAAGVDATDYTYEHLFNDYITYGFAHATARVMGFNLFGPDL
jgi:aminoglycoside phosphotransferase (APT) family kinase protein